MQNYTQEKYGGKSNNCASVSCVTTWNSLRVGVPGAVEGNQKKKYICKKVMAPNFQIR